MGCKNIEEYIPENCFINITPFNNDLDLIKNKIEYILNNSDTLYDEYLPRIKELKQRFKTEKTFNLWEKIKFEIDSK